MNIKLNTTEKKIVSLLQQAAKVTGSQIRIAGGWTRDKLLGKESNDIDIAIDNMTGFNFARFVNKEINQQLNTERADPHLVKANPDQSKHLETAILKICGVDVDFVNLRTETYTDSRIPVMKFGTAQEDAMRRDLTINAMFFNITDPNNMFVEDLVGGQQDLENHIARTPTDPKQTFLDDPLRILRVIRFCARFGLTPVDELVQAARDPDVQEAFKTKISRERIWAEMVGAAKPDGWKTGFINGPDPYYAVSLVNKMNFRDILFRPRNPDEFLLGWDRDQNNVYHDLNVWDHTMLAFKTLTSMSLPDDPEVAAIRHLTLLFHDLGKLDIRYTQVKPDGTNSFKKHEERSAELASIILDELSAPANVRDRIVKMISEHCRFMNVNPKCKDSVLRRIIKDVGDDWNNLIDVSMSDAYGKLKKQQDPLIREEFEIARTRMAGLIANQGGQTKPARPINGHDLMALGVPQGPKMGELMKALDEVLLETPDISKEDAIALVKSLM